MARMFGTDGVRGIANERISCELSMAIGLAGATVLAKDKKHPVIIIGTDTRKSKDMIKYALISGICASGGKVLDAGVIPTPSLPYLTRKYNASAAVMISASHNPMQDNGIKWFDKNGYKLSNELEDEIEQLIHDGLPTDRPTGSEIGTYELLTDAAEDYKKLLISSTDVPFDGLHIALDCANGASSDFAADVFSRLGAKVSVICNTPDGCNINAGCGSTHINKLCEYVKEVKADFGFAFDGDADRLIAVDENGNEINGDQIMGICAIEMKKRGRLKKDTLVITIMSNLGLKLKMLSQGIKVVETAVGDKHVLAAIRDNDYNFGGEQSGHIIFFDLNTSGDGMMSAIQLASIIKSANQSLSQLAASIPLMPQCLINVRVDKSVIESAATDKDMKNRIDEITTRLGDSGRVLVRASGTEPLIRIMLEGMKVAEIEEYARYIAEPIVEKFDGIIK